MKMDLLFGKIIIISHERQKREFGEQVTFVAPHESILIFKWQHMRLIVVKVIDYLLFLILFHFFVLREVINN